MRTRSRDDRKETAPTAEEPLPSHTQTWMDKNTRRGDTTKVFDRPFCFLRTLVTVALV
jgi:hypothetical protein